MKIIIITTAALLVFSAPVMASQSHNTLSHGVQSLTNASAKGKVHLNDFHVTHKFDKASAKLF